MEEKMKKKIFIAWDYKLEGYVWATSPHDLQVESPAWGHNYQEVYVTDRQYNALRNGGWIAAVTKKGVRVRI